MSEISDYSCMVAGCTYEAMDLIQTEDGEFVVLCGSHYATESYGVGQSGLEVSARVLMCDTAGSWFFMPEKGDDDGS